MEIPIIGQPRLNDWFLTVSLTCPCGKPVLLHGQPQNPNAITVCECRKAYMISGMPKVLEDGSIHMPIASGNATPAV